MIRTKYAYDLQASQIEADSKLFFILWHQILLVKDLSSRFTTYAIDSILMKNNFMKGTCELHKVQLYNISVPDLSI